MNRELIKYLLDNGLDIYEISKYLNIDHKTVRYFMKINNLNHSVKFIPQKRIFYTEPSEEFLFSSLSILAHSIYLCEGWHTNKTNTLHFFNQDIQLIKIFCKCLLEVYSYQKVIPIILVYNYSDKKSNDKVQKIILEFQDSSKYKIQYCNDSTRNNPIIRVKTGGINLSKLFIENAYKILHSK